MTQDDVIEMARDSGMELYGLGKNRARFVHHLEAFANLVAAKAEAKEREACAKLIDPTEEHRKDASWGYIGGDEGVEMLDALAAAIRARG